MPVQRQKMPFSAAAAILIAVAAAVAGCKKKAPPPPPPEVLFIPVTTTNLSVFQDWIGTLDGYVNAQIRAQVTGYLQKQDYAEGSLVKKGDLLFEIDPRPFQAALDQAQGRVAQSKAMLAKTELDVKRYSPLVKEEAISQETLDNALQANLGAKAQVQADEAAVESAALNLSFTKITSPIDGLAGTALAQIGDLLSASGPVLTTVSTIDPIKVYFQANEQSYLSFWKRFASDSGTNTDLTLRLILSDGSVFPEKGRFFYADRQINPTTGTLQIVGLFPNPHYVLRPGQYGLVRAQVLTKTNAVIIPQRAVMQSQGGYEVAVVESDNKAHVKSVRVGQQIGTDWVIESGLTNGEHLIVEGTQKAREGAAVTPVPYGTPAGTPPPKPEH
jgi:membrane fusion protein (multidrug efflux system)